jgi:hypothetical protein
LSTLTIALLSMLSVLTEEWACPLFAFELRMFFAMVARA